MHGGRKYIASLLVVAVFGLWLANSTRPVSAYVVVSEAAVQPPTTPAPSPDFTWGEFGKAAARGFVSGFTSGYVAGKNIVGAAVGAVVGAVVAAVGYVLGWLFGAQAATALAYPYPEKVLD